MAPGPSPNTPARGTRATPTTGHQVPPQGQAEAGSRTWAHEWAWLDRSWGQAGQSSGELEPGSAAASVGQELMVPG